MNFNEHIFLYCHSFEKASIENLGSYKVQNIIGPVAQWIERPPPKRQVGRSIRPRIIDQIALQFGLGVLPEAKLHTFFPLVLRIKIVGCCGT